MKKLLLFLSVVLLASSCTVSYLGTNYGKVNRKCPTMNQTAFFYEYGTGKQFMPKYVFRKSR